LVFLCWLHVQGDEGSRFVSDAEIQSPSTSASTVRWGLVASAIGALTLPALYNASAPSVLRTWLRGRSGATFSASHSRGDVQRHKNIRCTSFRFRGTLFHSVLWDYTRKHRSGKSRQRSPYRTKKVGPAPFPLFLKTACSGRKGRCSQKRETRISEAEEGCGSAAYSNVVLEICLTLKP